MSFARVVLLVAGLGVGVLYGLPLLLVPVRWGRVWGWTAPDDLRLTRYFGRCLGGTVIGLSGLALAGAFDPAYTRIALGVAALTLFLQAGVHVVGMLERSQPRSETVEGVAWLGMAVLFAALAIA